MDDFTVWTAKKVLEMRPAWIQRFYLCEINDRKLTELRTLKRTHDRNPTGRHVSVIPGDFNKSIDTILLANRIRNRTPAFALLDMHTSECDWDTVRKIARHKPKGMKIEILYFLATGWLPRALSRKEESSATKWWGNDEWRTLKTQTQIDWATSLCSRFQRELDYRFAHAWPIYRGDDSQRIYYYLVHATDHPAAPSLMRSAYRTACGGRAGTPADDQLSLFNET